MLYDQLLRHTLDERLKTPADRHAAAALYFPLVPMMLCYQPLQQAVDHHLRVLWRDRLDVRELLHTNFERC